MAAPCSSAGTWQRDLLEQLLALPDERGGTYRLASVLGLSVERCNMEVLDIWFRQKLQGIADPYTVKLLGVALARSGRPENVASARRAIVNPRFTEELRIWMLQDIVMSAADPSSAGVEFLAAAFRAHGGSPPMAYVLIRRPDVVAAKRDLFDAALLRSDAAGSIGIINAIMSDGLRYERAHPWFLEISEHLESIVAGRRSVAPQMRQFVSERIQRYRVIR
jgi:hypothetical protein